MRLQKPEAQEEGIPKEEVSDLMIKISWDEAIEILKRGNPVIYPTETCFGLGIDATKKELINKIYQMKRRPLSKPISIAFSDVEMVKKFLDIGRTAEKIARAFMPGPLTLVVKSKSGKIGFRIPDFDKVREMIRKFGKPITATSANISGMPPPYKFEELPDFAPVVDELPKGKKPSTVFDLETKKILREGPIKLEEILNAF